MTDMTDDIFAETDYGQIALEKLRPVPNGFRFYEAAWVDNAAFKLTGAEFRIAKSGPNKGLLSVMVPDTKRVAYVTPAEIQARRELECSKP